MRQGARSHSGGLAVAGAMLALVAPGGAQAVGQSSAGSAAPPRFPTPASALPQGGAAGSPTTGTLGSAATPRPASKSPTVVMPGLPATAPVTPGAAPASPAAGTPTRPAAAGVLPAAPQGQVRRRETAARGTALSPGAIVAAALAALLILVCAAWGAARWWAYEPHWALSARHSFSEAGLRVSATWGELADWIRLGH